MISNSRLAAFLVFVACPATAAALDYVSFERDGRPIHLTGKVVVEAEDGGLMALDREGVLWVVEGSEVIRRKQDGREFEPLSRDELARKLLERMPRGSRVHHTANYVICYNTTAAYAKWCGALYERLYRGFYAYWPQQGFELQKPAFPLVALIFNSQRSYNAYAERDLGADVAKAISFGYYSQHTNRITTYDLTGVESLARRAGRISSAAHVNRILSQPRAERNVATIVHEATHQLAYNSGMHARFADVPLWVSEGIAIFFETPDLRNSRGWGTIGAMNRVRLRDFRRYLPNRPADSLHTLLADHHRFRNTQTAAAAYAECWALTYYLLRTRSDEYIAYLRQMAQKPSLVEDDPDARIAQFEAAFGQQVPDLDQQFLRHVLQLR